MAQQPADPEIQAQMEAFKKADAEKQKLMVSRQQFLGQLHENQPVHRNRDAADERWPGMPGRAAARSVPASAPFANLLHPQIYILFPRCCRRSPGSCRRRSAGWPTARTCTS